jgi:hypothetical protein
MNPLTLAVAAESDPETRIPTDVAAPLILAIESAANIAKLPELLRQRSSVGRRRIGEFGALLLEQFEFSLTFVDGSL